MIRLFCCSFADFPILVNNYAEKVIKVSYDDDDSGAVPVLQFDSITF